MVVYLAKKKIPNRIKMVEMVPLMIKNRADPLIE